MSDVLWYHNHADVVLAEARLHEAYIAGKTKQLECCCCASTCPHPRSKLDVGCGNPAEILVHLPPTHPGGVGLNNFPWCLDCANWHATHGEGIELVT